MQTESFNKEKEILRKRLDNSGFVRPIGWNNNEDMIMGWTSFTVTLFFLNGHLPETQHQVCDCVREYASLIGKEAKFYMSPVSSRLHLAKNGKSKLLTENDISKVSERGERKTVKFLMASHETMEEYNALGNEYPIARYDDGFIIQAGPKPELGDRKVKQIPSHYGKVHDLLRPLYPPPEEQRKYLIGSVIDFDPFTKDINRYSKEEQAQRSLDFYNRWMNRFSPDTKMLPLYKRKKKLREIFFSLLHNREGD